MQDSGFEILSEIARHSYSIVRSLIKCNPSNKACTRVQDYPNIETIFRKFAYIDRTNVRQIRLIILNTAKNVKKLKSLLILNIVNLIKSFVANAYDYTQYTVFNTF